tara:strand:- start:727 stop:1377 length:651 start_codon:yes stop_codon:yes gene_type:complete
MRKIVTLIFCTFFLTSISNAEMKYGLTGSLTFIDATGTETEGGESNSGSADNLVVVPSIFLEYGMGNLSVGLDYIPLSADVSSKAKKRTDVETSVAGTAAETSTVRNQSAQASLEDHITLYANYMLNDTYFLKAGIGQVTLSSDESLATGSKYGNVDVDAYLIGLGYASGNGRIELVYTDYDDISLTSSTARTGVTTNNKIEADLDTVSLKYSYVF